MGGALAVYENSIITSCRGVPESATSGSDGGREREDEIRAFERGDVGAAGNHLTMRFLMGPLAENAVEVPLISRPYQLAVLPGRENIVAPLRVALDRLKNSGEFDRIVEQYLSSPVRRTWLERYASILAFGGGFVMLLFVGGTMWNRSLHRQVQARTKAVERTERRYRDLVDNASDMIYRTDPFGRFTFVNPVATRILGFDEGELLSMKYFELMRPDWVPRAMGFYGRSAKTPESTISSPGPQEGRRGYWIASTCGDHHWRRIEGFQGWRATLPIASPPFGAACRARFRLGHPGTLDPDHGLGRAVDRLCASTACEELSGSRAEVPAIVREVPFSSTRSRRDSRRSPRSRRRWSL